MGISSPSEFKGVGSARSLDPPAPVLSGSAGDLPTGRSLMRTELKFIDMTCCYHIRVKMSNTTAEAGMRLCTGYVRCTLDDCRSGGGRLTSLASHEETSRAMGCPSRDTDRGWLRFDYSLNPISAFIFRISASSSGLSVASVSWMATFFKAPVNLNGTW